MSVTMSAEEYEAKLNLVNKLISIEKRLSLIEDRLDKLTKPTNYWVKGKKKNNDKKWKPTDIEQLIKMKKEGKTNKEIANSLGKTEVAINTKLTFLVRNNMVKDKLPQNTIKS